MLNSTDELPPLRFSLKTLFWIVTGLAVLCWLGPSLLEALLGNRIGYSILVALMIPIASVIGWLGGSCCSRLARSFFKRPTVRKLTWAMFVLAMLAACYILWARYRWCHIDYDDPLWPRSFPYPDQISVQYHDWLDALYPARPNSFKIHGEYYRVWRTFDYLSLFGILLSSFLFGLLSPHLLIRLCRSSITGLLR
jgi:hypothetical protein